VTISVPDMDFFSTNLTLRTHSRHVCTLSLDVRSCDQTMTSLPVNMSDVCACHAMPDGVYSVYIRQHVTSSDSGEVLEAVLPAMERYSPVTASANIGHIPPVYTPRGNFTYQINNGRFSPLKSEQNVSVCDLEPVRFTVCSDVVEPKSVLNIRVLQQDIKAKPPCAHAIELFNFTDVDTHKISFSYDVNDWCSFRESFTVNLREKQLGCKGTDAEFFDVFGSGSREWRLAFRGTSGIGREVKADFLKSSYHTTTVEAGCKQLDARQPCHHHYRNDDVMDNWGRGFSQVTLVLYGDRGQRLAHVVFDARNSDPVTWFSQGRILTSSWTDLTTLTTNIFSIPGYAGWPGSPYARSFHMNHVYGGCPGDEGWFTAVDAPADGTRCPWEGTSPRPVFLYALGDHVTNWTTGKVGHAQVMAIFVKY